MLLPAVRMATVVARPYSTRYSMNGDASDPASLSRGRCDLVRLTSCSSNITKQKPISRKSRSARVASHRLQRLQIFDQIVTLVLFQQAADDTWFAECRRSLQRPA